MSVSSSAMLSSLQRDSSTQDSLVAFLSIAEVCALHDCCRTWRQALDQPTGASATQDRSMLSVCVYTHLDVLLRSRWVLPLISALEVSLYPVSSQSFPRMPEPIVVTGLSPEDEGTDGARAHESASAQLWAWRHLLQRLPSFPRLRSLKVSFREGDGITVDPDGLQSCFGAIGRQLQSLHLCSPIQPEQSAQPTLSVLSAALPCLPCLCTLIVEDSQSWHAYFDPDLYTALPSLTRLSTCNRFPIDTPLAAYEALARCAHLTDLCYSFQRSLLQLRDTRDLHWQQQHALRAEHYHKTLGSFIGTRVALQSQGVVQPLRVLRSDGVEMTEDLFRELSRLPSLTKLRPSHWDTDISAAGWMAGFGGLSNLERLWIGGNMYFAFTAQESVAPLTALQQCRNLRRLQLTLMVLSTELLIGLADSLILLECLHLERVQLESLAALSRFPRLTSLILVLSSLLDRSAVGDLPPMAALTHLRVDDTIRGLVNGSDGELYASLSARMPKLRLECLELLSRGDSLQPRRT